MSGIIKAENLTKKYGDGIGSVTALDNVSLQIKSGAFVAVTGSSGSGKSTLLHVLGGVDRPDSGRLYFNGKDVFAHSEKELARYRRECVSVIYQFYNLVPTLSVRDNILLPLMLGGRKPDEKRLDEILKITGLHDREFYYPTQLSGGQQQRAAVARAVMTGAPVILADEPTGNLDSKNTENVAELLRRCVKDCGQTVVVVTHDARVAAYADRQIGIEDGAIVSDTGE
ncbi:MAG: ABC transporter ATP-binding protein [Clostridia bacterium]|nr:ABC transporter ATP-binding protein [Clostridia bacterium]